MATDRRIVFISYWTSKYKKSAERLKASLDKLGLESDINEIPDKGWYANVRFKPTYILQMAEKHKDAYAVVWIDADGDVVQRPDLFFSIEEDLAVRFKPIAHKNCDELLSGTVFVRTHEKMIVALKKWIEALKVAPMGLSTPEQSVLHDILDSLKISVNRLPEPYCRILADRGRGGVPADSVIVHYQFSRETRFDRTPAPHLSEPTRKGLVVRAQRYKPDPDLSPPRPHRTFQPRKPVKEKVRIPDDIRNAQRRRRILALRSLKNTQIKEKLQLDAAVKLAAGMRTRVEKMKLLEAELRGEDGAPGPLGGVRGQPISHRDLKRARINLALKPSASAFDGLFAAAHRPVLVMGNSPTMTHLPVELLKRVPTIGCNRALQWKEFAPDILMVADREPYAQEYRAGRLDIAVNRKTKILVADSVFDPSILLRGPYSNLDRRAQPVPASFDPYIYKIGPRKKEWTYESVAAGKHTLPINVSTFESPVVSCLNIAGSMLQAAAILGAKVIGVIGIEFQWPKGKASHFYGDGTKVGAYPQDSSLNEILSAMRQIKLKFKEAGITVINLSPVTHSPFATVFKRGSLESFKQAMAADIPWEGVDREMERNETDVSADDNA